MYYGRLELIHEWLEDELVLKSTIENSTSRNRGIEINTNIARNSCKWIDHNIGGNKWSDIGFLNWIMREN